MICKPDAEDLKEILLFFDHKGARPSKCLTLYFLRESLGSNCMGAGAKVNP